MAPITTGIGNGVNAITDEYPHQLRWLVNCFYTFIAICQLASFLAGKYQLRHKKAPVVPESNKTQFKRLPLAFLDFYRILSIRDTVGVEYYSLNVAEVFLACVYIISPLIREYINSTLADGTLSPIVLYSSRASFRWSRRTNLCYHTTHDSQGVLSATLDVGYKVCRVYLCVY